MCIFEVGEHGTGIFLVDLDQLAHKRLVAEPLADRHQPVDRRDGLRAAGVAGDADGGDPLRRAPAGGRQRL